FPAPLSPTTPRISPSSIVKEIPSSARSTPRRVGNSTVRSWTARRVMRGRRSSQTRVEGIAQPVAEQVDGQHHHAQHHAREDRNPPLPGEQEIVADANQRAQRGLGGRQTDAEEGQ